MTKITREEDYRIKLVLPCGSSFHLRGINCSPAPHLLLLLHPSTFHTRPFPPPLLLAAVLSVFICLSLYSLNNEWSKRRTFWQRDETLTWCSLCCLFFWWELKNDKLETVFGIKHLQITMWGFIFFFLKRSDIGHIQPKKYTGLTCIYSNPLQLKMSSMEDHKCQAIIKHQ